MNELASAHKTEELIKMREYLDSLKKDNDNFGKVAEQFQKYYQQQKEAKTPKRVRVESEFLPSNKKIILERDDLAKLEESSSKPEKPSSKPKKSSSKPRKFAGKSKDETHEL